MGCRLAKVFLLVKGAMVTGAESTFRLASQSVRLFVIHPLLQLFGSLNTQFALEEAIVSLPFPSRAFHIVIRNSRSSDSFAAICRSLPTVECADRLVCGFCNDRAAVSVVSQQFGSALIRMLLRV